MARINMRGLIVAALAVAALAVSGGREANAGLNLSGGIVVVGGGGNGSDPPYTYQIAVDLTGTIQPLPNWTTITADNLVGVTPLSPWFTEDVPNGAGWAVTSIIWNPITNASDVTWTYLGFPNALSSPAGGSLLLGVLEITTTTSYASGYPSILPTSLDYNYSLNGGSSQGGESASGTVGLTQGGVNLLSTPEPSTLIAPLVVLLGLPVYTLLKRKRRGSEQSGITS